MGGPNLCDVAPLREKRVTRKRRDTERTWGRTVSRPHPRDPSHPWSKNSEFNHGCHGWGSRVPPNLWSNSSCRMLTADRLSQRLATPKPQSVDGSLWRSRNHPLPSILPKAPAGHRGRSADDRSLDHPTHDSSLCWRPRQPLHSEICLRLHYELRAHRDRRRGFDEPYGCLLIGVRTDRKIRHIGEDVHKVLPGRQRGAVGPFARDNFELIFDRSSAFSRGTLNGRHPLRHPEKGERSPLAGTVEQ